MSRIDVDFRYLEFLTIVFKNLKMTKLMVFSPHARELLKPF